MNIWSRCLNNLKKKLSVQEYQKWIIPLKVVQKENYFFIYAPNEYFLKYINSRYEEIIKNSIENICNIRKVTIDFLTDERIKSNNFFSKEKKKEKNSGPNNLNHSAASNELYGFEEALYLSKENHVEFGSPLKKEYNFKNFVIGKSNEIAQAAAIQVSNKPGLLYNPFFIHGNSGVGKTHLMHCIGNHILNINNLSKVLYVTSERFVKDYVDALRLNSGDEFQNFYRSVDVLLVDDIHFIAGKSGSQEEFFHTFNVLLENKKQIVLSCDKYPKEIPKLENRLASRFGYGLTVTLDNPDLKTRTEILLHKSNEFGHKINRNSAFFIAKNIKSNVRELEGALRRVLNYAQFRKNKINEAFIHQCLKELIFINNKIVKIDSIQKVVSDYYNIKINELTSKKRNRSIARPRQIAIFLTKEYTNHSLSEIGNLFGGRDHSTVLHSIKTIKSLITHDFNIQNDYQILSNKLIY